MVIQIEIYPSPWKEGAWCIRIGDIEGSTEHSNTSKEEVISEIREEMRMEEEKNKPKGVKG